MAWASKTRLALPETARRELISSAHEITIALSKNSAQSASMSAAPARNFAFEVFILQYGVRLNGIITSHGTGESVRPTVNFTSHGSWFEFDHRSIQLFKFGLK